MLIDEDHDGKPNAEAALPQQQPAEAALQNYPPSPWDQFPDCSYDSEYRDITVNLRNTEFGVATGNEKLKGAAPNEFASIFHLFKDLFPVNRLREELLPATNGVDPSLNLTEGEFWIYLVLHFAMAQYSDMPTSEFFLVNKECCGRLFTMNSVRLLLPPEPATGMLVILTRALGEQGPEALPQGCHPDVPVVGSEEVSRVAIGSHFSDGDS